MPQTLTIYESARKYGLNDFTTSGASLMESILGPAGEPVLTGSGNVGTVATATVLYGNGFNAIFTFYVVSSTTLTLTIAQFKSPSGELLVNAQGSVTFNASNVGEVANSSYIYSGADTLYGNAGNNKLQGYAGNDRIDGGAGTDTAVFQGLASQYTVSRSGSSMSVSGPDGTDTLLSVERLQFDNFTVAYDTAGTGGQAYRIYQAAFNRTPDAGGLGYWIHALDSGASLRDVAAGFVTSAEFHTVYGSNPTNAELVTRYYENVLHRAPEAGGYNYWLGVLDQHLDTAAGVLSNISESAENQAGVIGAIGNGFAYTPYP